LVIAGRYTPRIFEPAEHDLDAVSPLVAALVVVDCCVPPLSIGDASVYPVLLQCFSGPVAVIAVIPEQQFDVLQALEQCPCADIVAHLSGGDEQVNGSSLAVTHCVQLVFMPYLVQSIR